MFKGISRFLAPILAISLWAGTFSKAVAAAPPVAAPFTNISSSQIQANWTNDLNNSSGTTFYAILSIAPSPNTNNLPGNVPIATDTNPFANFSSLLPNTVYYVDVNATDPINNSTSTFTSLGSTVTLANVPTAADPTGVQSSQLTANWDANGNPAGTNYLAQLTTDATFNTITAFSTTANTSSTFSGLLANTTYYTRTQASNSEGIATGFTNPVSTVTLANAPGASAFSNITTTQLQANWTSNGNPAGTSYLAQLTTDATFNTITASSTTSNTSATFAGLSANTTYYTRTQGSNFSGIVTGFTSPVSAITLPNAPGTSAFNNITTTQLQANWTSNGNPAGTTYLAQISADSGFGNIAAFVTTSVTSALFTGLTPGTNYYGHVQAIGFGGASTSFTSLGSATTTANVPTASPFTNVTNAQIQANWNANGNPAGTSYTVILSTGASPSTNGLAGNSTSVTTNVFALFTSVAVNTVYYVDVQAGNSAFVSLGSTSTLANVPALASPVNVQTNQFTADWGPNGNPLGTTYSAQLSSDSGFASILATSSTLNTSVTFPGLTPNTPYYSRVQAVNQNGIPSGFANLPSVVTQASAPGPGVFTNMTNSQIQANWTSNGNPVGTYYNVIESTVASPSTNGLTSNISSTTTNTFAIFTGLNVNTKYFADVATQGSSSYISLGFTSTLANAPTSAGPTNIGINQITANWGANGNPAGTSYKVQASTDSLFGSISVSVTTTSFSAALTGLAANTQYFMRVQAVNLNSVPTAFTALPSASTLESIPNPPGFAAYNNVATNQVQANWTANSNPPSTTYTAILSTAPSPSTNGLSGNQTAPSTTNLFTTFTGLVPNTLYYVDVNGTSSGGSSVYTSLGSVPTLANAPTVAAASNIQQNQFTANWGANNNPTGTSYLAQASLNAGFTSITNSVSTTSVFAIMTGLTPNTSYYVRVEATNQASISTAFITLPTVTTLINLPNPPAGAGFSNATASQIQANWIANGNPPSTIYTAILSTAPSPSTNGLSGNQTALPTNSTAVTFAGLAPNTLYYVDVKASNAAGDSSYTSLGSAPTLANPPAPGNPTNIGTNQITANWAANGNPDGTNYLVQASTDSGFGSITSAVPTIALSATLTGLSAQTTYYMRVRAANQVAAPTAFILLPQATTLANPPNLPGAAGFTGVNTTQLTANWTANGNPAGTSYNAVLSTAPSPSTNGLSSNMTINTTNLSALFTGLSPNMLYYVEVKAVSSGGSSAYTGLGSAGTLANPPTPGNPTNIGTNQITANWTANGNPAGTNYLVQASTDSGFSTITSAVPSTGFSATLTGLSAQTNYYMRVQAFNQAAIPTAFVLLPQATTLTVPPNVPGGAGFTGVTASQLQANWTANGNPAGTFYNAVLSTAPSPSTNGLAGNRTINTTNLFAPFTGLFPNTLYYVEVNAVSMGGNSTYTGLGSVPTLANPPTPGNPTNIGTNQITANWTANGNPAGTNYLVQASTDSGFGSITSAVPTTGLSATLTGLSAQTNYYMRIQASNQAAIPTSFVSLPQATTLPTPPGVPGPAGFTGVDTTQLIANWIANGNPAGTLYNAVLSTAPSPSTNGLSSNKTISTTNLFAPFTALSANTLYYVEVNATSSGGNSAYTSLGSVPTLANPPTPGNPTAIGTNQITANWTANGNPVGTSYLVQASTDSGFGTVTSAVPSSGLSATLTGLSAQTNYYMRVQAYNQAAIPTAFVLLPQATTLTVPPNVPSAAGFTGVTASQLQANWTANGNPAGTFYNAVLSTAPSPSTNNLAGNIPINTTNHFAPFSGLSPNTLYYVEVNAASSGGDSAYTSLGSVPTLANPPTPGNPTAIGTNQITANWTTNGNPAGTNYLVQASTDSGFGSITSAVPTTGLSAILTGLLPQTVYYMRVQASNQAAIPTTFVLLPQATTLTVPPNAPSAAGFTGVTVNQLQANWTANGNPVGTLYNAVLSTAPSPSTNGLSGNKTISTTNLSVPFTALSPNTLYYVEVNAASTGGNSTYTGLGSVPTLANPPTPGNPTAVGTNQITANWTANGNPAGTNYLAQASIDSGFSSITSAVPTINLSATLTGLLAQTTYYMRVQASNQAGTPTVFILLPQAITLTTPPNVPVAAGFTGLGIGQITANWTANGNPAGTLYNAVLSTAPSPSTNGLSGNKTISTTNLSAPFTGLNPNTLYYAEVNATSSGGNSAYTGLGSVATLANPPTPGNPTAIGTNQITANWTANGNPSGTNYLVQASTDAGFGSIASAIPTLNLTATLAGLLPQTTYYMRAQASNQNGVPTAFVLLPQATTLTVPPNVPGAAGFTGLGTTQLTANWTANGNPVGTLYNAVLSTAPSPGTNGLTGNTTVSSTNLAATFTVLNPNSLYYVDVNASSSGGKSAYASLGSVATLANSPTAGNPTNIGTTQITANWGANSNPSSTTYRAQASLDSGFGFISVELSTTSLSIPFTNLAPDTTYFMRVQAVNLTGTNSSFVLLPSTATHGNVPVTPGAASFSNISTTQLQTNWTQNGNPTGTSYVVILSSWPSPSTNGFSGNQSSTSTVTFAIFAGLFANTRYYADVKAANVNGSSAYTHLEPTGRATLANAPVSGNPTSVGANQFTANWSNGGNPAGTTYLVQASQDSGFVSIAKTNTSTNTFSVILGLSPGTTYYSRVQAINLDSVGSLFTVLPTTVTLGNAPSIPGPLPFSNLTSTQLQANWTANNNPAGTLYTIVLSTGTNPSLNGYTGNRSNTTSATSTLFSGLFPNTFYYAQVKASNINGVSAYTDLGSIPTLANPPAPAPPTAVGPSQITAHWGANGNPAGTFYQVQASPDPGFNFYVTGSTTSTFFTFNGLIGNTTYYMQVQAFNQAFIPSAFTALPPAQTIVNTPGVPVLSVEQIGGVAQITDTSVTWQWTSVSNAVSYYLIDQNGTHYSPPILPPSPLLYQDVNYPVNTGLTPNTPYQRSVVAVNAVGIASTSTLVQVTTLARQPGEPVALAVTPNSITIGWGANGNPFPTQYVAQMSLPDGTVRQKSGTDLQATFDQLTGATTYFFTVTALNAGTAPPASGLSVYTPPLTATSGRICPAAQVSVLPFNEDNGSVVRVEVPAGAFTQCVTLKASFITSFPNALSNGTPLRGTNVGIEITNVYDPSLQPIFPLTLTIPYTTSGIAGALASQLVLARYDVVHNAWVMLRSTVDPAQGVISAQTDQLSKFQIMVAIPSSNLSNVRVYPNPFRPSLGHQGVNIVNLPADATVDLFSLTGEKVQALTATGAGAAFWDGRNQAGRPVASGVYFAVVKSGGDKTILKVAVQR